MMTPPNPVRLVKELTAGYSDKPQPLAAYLTLMGVFGAFVTGLAGAVRFSRAKLPEPGPRVGDMMLLGIAAHKLARIVTKDRVTASLRAPFVRYKGGEGEGEVEEEPRGEGIRQALGSLLTCPYCFGVWIATPMWFGLVLAPRLTRFVAGILATVTGADFMHRLYVVAKGWGEK